MAGRGIGTAAAQGAYASAYGQQASNNAWMNAANQIDWGGIFGGRPGEIEEIPPWSIPRRRD
jgi:hypothetical protein